MNIKTETDSSLTEDKVAVARGKKDGGERNGQRDRGDGKLPVIRQ